VWLVSLFVKGATADASVVLHPIAFAGWLGLIVTAVNLFPIGQLDGGHVAYGVLGKKGAFRLGVVSFIFLVLMGLVSWSGWLTWALIVYFLSGFRHSPPMDDVTPVSPRRIVFGTVLFVVLMLIVIPVPEQVQSFAARLMG
jgi:membrane-associated protease RseP (regulator of RpoE activity)